MSVYLIVGLIISIKISLLLNYDYHIEIPVGYDLDVMAGIKAYDKQSGDLR